VARLGILGGTFNPPHVAHLVCAQEARWQLGLELVLLVPARVPPHKEVPGDPGAEARLELCRLAADGEPGVEASREELDRPGPSYTVDTLRRLREARPEDDLTLIVGADMARDLPSWREPEGLVRLARVAVAERAGEDREEIAAALAVLEPARPVEFLEMPRLDISSSGIRARVGEGRPIRHLVPQAVEERIRRDGIYAAGVSGAGGVSA